MIPSPASPSATPPPDLDYRSLFRSIPGIYLVLSPDFVILEATDERLHATMTRREDIIGRPLFEVFPDNPNDPEASGVHNLRQSLERVLRDRVPDVMAVQKYDIRRSAEEGGEFEERYWSPLNVPILDADGEVRFIIHRVEDVTEFVRVSRARAPGNGFSPMAAEVYYRAQEIQEANRQLHAANSALAEAHAQARASEQRVTEILESITDAFFTLDRNWCFTYVNAEAARVLQRRSEELLGERIWDAFPEAYGSPFHRHYQTAMEEGVAVAFEAFFPPLAAWFGVRAYPNAEGLSVYFVDVTGRKRAEVEASLLHALALRIGEADSLENALLGMLREVVEGTGHDFGEIWLPDAEGGRLVRAFGLPREDSDIGAGLESAWTSCARGEGLIGQAWEQGRVIWSEDLAKAADFRRAEEASRAGLRSAMAVPVRAGDAVVAVLAFFRSQPTPEDPWLVRVLTRAASEVGTLIQRKRTEAAIRKLNGELAERTRLVTMAGRVARLGGWTIDLVHGTVLWSDEVCAIHDAPPGTTVGLEEGLEAYTAECRPVITEHVRACAEEGIPYDVEVEKVTFAGRRIWVRAIGEPVRSADGRITHIQGAFQDITTQRLAHQRQLESKRRYRLLFEQSLDGILHTVPDGRILSANPAACRMLGYTEREICEVGRRGIVDSSDPRVEALIEQRRQTGQAIGEVTMIRRDGNPLPVEVSSQVFRDADGNEHSSMFIRDISERKRAEAVLREREETFRQITENIREIFWMFNPDFTEAIYVSPAYAEIWGSPIEALYEDPRLFVSTVHPEDRESLIAAMLTVRTTALRGVDYRVVRPDGEIRWVRSRGYPVHDQHGDVYRVVGTTEDITDRKRAEAERAAAEADYQHLFETAPYGIYALDGEGRFTKLNPAAERLLERSSAELIGEHFSTVIAPADLWVAQDGFDRVISGRENDIEFDERIRQASGGERLLRVTESAILDGDRIVGTHGIARDITDEVEQQKTLRRAERLASVGTLLSGVAHELNNPLHAIGNFAELMLAEERNADDQEALEIIRRESHRAARVVANLQLITRDTQEEGLRREPVDLNDVVQHVLKVRRYALETGNVEVRTDLGQNLPAIQGDRGQMEQVLLNLVVNAEQAMANQDGPRRLILRTRGSSDGVALHVIDSGSGIQDDALERIFDPFYTTKAPGEGTGLGLSLVHSLVSEHGGQVHVESELGSGTAFRIELPRATRPVEVKDQSTITPSSTGSRRVLVVDDEPSIRRVVSRFLTRRGNDVVEAAEGGEALQLLESQHFDVIISDLRMPGLDGAELLRRLQAQGAGLASRLIFVTGDVAASRRGLWSDGAEIPILVKPVALELLARAIDALLSPERQ